MLILGLAGQARAGKDTIANYLAKRYGFVKFAFSDALYREVAEAFNLPDESLLRSDATKDERQSQMCLDNCKDMAFLDVAFALVEAKYDSDHSLFGVPLTPREVLQWWGAEYRRAENPNYWIQRASEFIQGLRDGAPYPEHAPQFFVEGGTRFENERAFIKSLGGNIWHIHRDIGTIDNGHISATPLPVLPGERELWNNDTVERLHYGIDLMLSQPVQQVKVLPMETAQNADTETQ